MQTDRALSEFISSRLGDDGIFRPDAPVIEVISRIMAKTTTGLLFHEFGRLVPTNRVAMIAVEHTQNTHPLAIIELHRRDHGGRDPGDLRG